MKSLIALVLGLLLPGFTVAVEPIAQVLKGKAEMADWERVIVAGDCTFKIPVTMELQAGLYKKMRDAYVGEVLKVEDASRAVVAQQKGVNAMEAEARKKYCRLIVETDRGKAGEFPKLGESLGLAGGELGAMDAALRKAVEDSRKSTPGMAVSILSWESLKEIKMNGLPMLYLSYRRALNGNAPVVVRQYRVPNYDCMFLITLSYREAEEDLWKEDLLRALSTIEFVKH